MGEKFAKLKEENKILVMLAFYSISIGLWNNFKQLWLQDNQLNVEQISQILSISGLFCAVFLLLFSKKFTLDKIRRVIITTVFLKFFNSIILCFLNHTGMINIINILIIFDTILEKIIVISIYPFIVTIKKENKLYSKRKLVEYLFSDLGILIGGILIGRSIAGIVVNYNICLLISIIFLALAFITIVNIKQPPVEHKDISNRKIIKKIVRDKITRSYLMFYFIGNIAMATGLGLKILMLTNGFKFSDSIATQYLLCIGLIADLIGIIALKYLTHKNDYIAISIKFGIRFLFYILAFLSNNMIICLIAITWSILISTAYENVSDAPYINRISNDIQFTFTNFRYIIGIIGTSIGLYFAGITYNFGIPYMLGLSGIFMIFQIGIAYYLIYLREKELNNNGEKEEKNVRIRI